MLAELRITPVEASDSFLKELAGIVRILEASPLSYSVHAMGTTLEGELDDVLDVVRLCHEYVRTAGARTLIELSLDDRPTPRGELERSLQHLREVALGVPLERLLPPA